uniref:uncharacterized protein LOC124067347 isoform X2 n=1 Tax=Scatophagus argus TaxID=75038 RepID=UPI001ED83FFE|nr:uncharacterized protein LOC124067347 isoform X2 [Scatophagus argus]
MSFPSCSCRRHHSKGRSFSQLGLCLFPTQRQDMQDIRLLVWGIYLQAPILGLTSVQLLNATLGGSVMFSCSLPVNPVRISWFYWQEHRTSKVLYHWVDGQTKPAANEYKNRCQVPSSEFSSGNISITLEQVDVGDDKKTFWVSASYRHKKISLCEKCCKSTLQVSAPYQDLKVTVNNTANRATCTAHGGYPAPRVSWTGRNKSGAAEQGLHAAEPILQQDPTERTYSVRSSVSVKDLQDVTCHIDTLHSNQMIKKEISDEQNDQMMENQENQENVSLATNLRQRDSAKSRPAG